MVEAQPELASQLRRVRGGYLKIQGTWVPYEASPLHYAHLCDLAYFDPLSVFLSLNLGCDAACAEVRDFASSFRCYSYSQALELVLSIRVAWPIRHDLVPLFG